MSGSIIFLFVLVLRGTFFDIIVFVLISSVGVQRCDAFISISSVGVQRRDVFIPTLGSRGHQCSIVKLVYTSLCISISLYVHPCLFLENYLRGL